MNVVQNPYYWLFFSGGGLSVKILKRTAKFENQDYSNTVRDLQNTKLNLPKKTKLFVDQTMREREHSISMI